MFPVTEGLNRDIYSVQNYPQLLIRAEEGLNMFLFKMHML